MRWSAIQVDLAVEFIREHKEAMTRGRLSRRVKALGMGSVAEYCAFLKTPGAQDLPAVREGRVYATDGSAYFSARARAWWRAWKSWRISCIRSCFLRPGLRRHSRGSTSRGQFRPLLDSFLCASVAASTRRRA